MKDEIIGGINYTQINVNPFSWQSGYHHYEPEVFSMNCYFEGFNLRQLKKITYIFNKFALAYQSYLHLLENKKDMPAKRGLQLTESKILRLVKYYKKTGRIDSNWNYNPNQIKMYIE